MYCRALGSPPGCGVCLAVLVSVPTASTGCHAAGQLYSTCAYTVHAHAALHSTASFPLSLHQQAHELCLPDAPCLSSALQRALPGGTCCNVRQLAADCLAPSCMALSSEMAPGSAPQGKCILEKQICMTPAGLSALLSCCCLACFQHLPYRSCLIQLRLVVCTQRPCTCCLAAPPSPEDSAGNGWVSTDSCCS